MRTFLMVALLLLAAGCAKNPADGTSEAQVNEPVEEEENTTPEPSDDTAPVETIEVTTERGSIAFVGSKVTASHEGNFPDFSGAVTLHPDSLVDSSVSITIDTTTLEADRERLTSHLRSDDFFDVENFPTSTFVSTSIAEGAEGNATHTITGNLTLRGVEKSIAFPATLELMDSALNIMSEFHINRQDFGITYAGMSDDLIRDEVVIRIVLSLRRGSADGADQPAAPTEQQAPPTQQ